MIIGKIVVGGFKAARKVLSGKPGKIALGIGAAVGLGGAAVGGGKIISANKKNKQAKAIQDQAIFDHDASLKETEEVLAKLLYSDRCQELIS